MPPAQMAQRVIDRVPPRLLLRVIPKPCMPGQLGPVHRPYVCLADYEELQGLPLREVVWRIYNGFQNNLDELVAAHPDAPFYDTKSYLFGEDCPSHPPMDALKEQDFYVMAISPGEELDCVPATWKAMALIATDYERFPEAHIVNHYLTKYKGQRPLTVNDLIHGVDYYGFKSLEDERAVVASQSDAYTYLSSADVNIHEIIDLFGVNALCWHGCGYIGPGFHMLSRVFFGKNLPISHELVQFCQLMSIDDVLPIQV